MSLREQHARISGDRPSPSSRVRVDMVSHCPRFADSPVALFRHPLREFVALDQSSFKSYRCSVTVALHNSRVVSSVSSNPTDRYNFAAAVSALTVQRKIEE